MHINDKKCCHTLIQESTCARLFHINFYPPFYISTSSIIDLPSFLSYIQSVSLHVFRFMPV